MNGRDDADFRLSLKVGDKRIEDGNIGLELLGNALDELSHSRVDSTLQIRFCKKIKIRGIRCERRDARR